MNESEKKELASNAAGIQLACVAVLRALIASHPDRDRLQADLNYEHERMLALMTPIPMPDQVLQMFHHTMQLVQDPGHGRPEHSSPAV